MEAREVYGGEFGDQDLPNYYLPTSSLPASSQYMLLLLCYLCYWIVHQWTGTLDNHLHDLAVIIRDDQAFNELQRIGLLPARIDLFPAEPDE